MHAEIIIDNRSAYQQGEGADQKVSTCHRRQVEKQCNNAQANRGAGHGDIHADGSAGS